MRTARPTQSTHRLAPRADSRHGRRRPEVRANRSKSLSRKRQRPSSKVAERPCPPRQSAKSASKSRRGPQGASTRFRTETYHRTVWAASSSQARLRPPPRLKSVGTRHPAAMPPKRKPTCTRRSPCCDGRATTKKMHVDARAVSDIRSRAPDRGKPRANLPPRREPRKRSISPSYDRHLNFRQSRNSFTTYEHTTRGSTRRTR